MPCAKYDCSYHIHFLVEHTAIDDREGAPLLYYLSSSYLRRGGQKQLCLNMIKFHQLSNGKGKLKVRLSVIRKRSRFNLTIVAGQNERRKARNRLTLLTEPRTILTVPESSRYQSVAGSPSRNTANRLRDREAQQRHRRHRSVIEKRHERVGNDRISWPPRPTPQPISLAPGRGPVKGPRLHQENKAGSRTNDAG